MIINIPLTLGTTFTTSPRGTYRNVGYQPCNRTQQDFMLALNLKNFNFTMYDDYFPLFSTFYNWATTDRFYRRRRLYCYRFNDQYTLHLYSGSIYRFKQGQSFYCATMVVYTKQKGANGLLKNFANQNAGQGILTAHGLLPVLPIPALRYPATRNEAILPNFNVFGGINRAWTMFFTKFYHSLDWLPIKPNTGNSIIFSAPFHCRRSAQTGGKTTGGRCGKAVRWRKYQFKYFNA